MMLSSSCYQLLLPFAGLPWGTVAAPLWAADMQQSPLSPDFLSNPKQIQTELKKAEIIPDVLDDFYPRVSLSLSYPSSHHSINLGNVIVPSEVSSAPIFEIHAFPSLKSTPTPTLRSNVTYTLVLTDPDATPRADPVMAEICHWITTGVSLPASEINAIEIAHLTRGGEWKVAGNITELLSYLAPSPPPKTGPHRYVFVLLVSKGGNDLTVGSTELKLPKERAHWGYGKVGKGVREWAKDNNLVVVGANFFYSKNPKQ